MHQIPLSFYVTIVFTTYVNVVEPAVFAMAIYLLGSAAFLLTFLKQKYRNNHVIIE